MLNSLVTGLTNDKYDHILIFVCLSLENFPLQTRSFLQKRNPLISRMAFEDISSSNTSPNSLHAKLIVSHFNWIYFINFRMLCYICSRRDAGEKIIAIYFCFQLSYKQLLLLCNLVQLTKILKSFFLKLNQNIQ